MICCLLAWLAAVPALAWLRRRHAAQTSQRCCATTRIGHMGNGAVAALAAAGAVLAAFAVVLALHSRSADAAWHPLGPICSTLDQLTFGR